MENELLYCGIENQIHCSYSFLYSYYNLCHSFLSYFASYNLKTLKVENELMYPGIETGVRCFYFFPFFILSSPSLHFNIEKLCQIFSTNY